MGASVSSLHRESTDSLILLVECNALGREGATQLELHINTNMYDIRGVVFCKPTCCGVLCRLEAHTARVVNEGYKAWHYLLH